MLTNAAIRLASPRMSSQPSRLTTVEDEIKFVIAQFIDTKVGEQARSKPILMTRKRATGDTLISNVGDTFATNGWYL